MPKILAIDDDRTVLRLIEKAFEDADVNLTTVSTAEEGLSILLEGDIDVCLLDIMLPEMNGLELAKKIRAIDARMPVIFITSMDDSDTAIEAMKLGAYEFCTKPLDITQVQDFVERAFNTRRLMRAPVTIQESSEISVGEGDQLVGKSPQMVEVYKQIGRVAAQMVPVLIRGESGTGKELIARAIYQHSQRNEECYLAVNCAALSETLLESELFGHEKGAFTGAERRHVGKFEQCNNGSIFLDEIGDMSPLLQSKVLRLLQEQKFERVGGTKTIETDARIISATNRDLEAMIQENEFRLDLYHRINAFEIHLPPLRERGEDIDLLIGFFIRRLSKQLGKNVEGISPDAMELLRGYQWPGNVRELQGVIRHALLMATGPVIVPENLRGELQRGSDSTAASVSFTPAASEKSDGVEDFVQARIDEGSSEIYAETLEMMERKLITKILSETSGNQSQAAEMLGITRGSLRNKIRSLGIVIEQVVSVD
ncbi:sigma-54-dependent transcriptional regulator [Mariniblastus fucicola]|nr:sigma-54 dependent transcriptional regulator [Mariniblastus fucicola]